jgi:hypothetical protein
MTGAGEGGKTALLLTKQCEPDGRESSPKTQKPREYFTRVTYSRNIPIVWGGKGRNKAKGQRRKKFVMTGAAGNRVSGLGIIFLHRGLKGLNC